MAWSRYPESTNDRVRARQGHLLQALHKGPAVREHLHQQRGEVQEPAGVRVLIARFRVAIARVTLGVMLAITVLNTAGARCRSQVPDSPYGPREKLREKKKEILEDHAKWLKEHPNPLPSELGPADFRCAALDGESFSGLDLRGAVFRGADLGGATFFHVRLDNVSFYDASLTEATFSSVTLKGANFGYTDLSDATFEYAILQDADFLNTELLGAVIGERVLGIPDSIRYAANLDKLKFVSDVDTLVALRDVFKKGGRRDLERNVTFAIQADATRSKFRWGNWIEAAVRYVGWELPTAYDRSPERALQILLVLIFVFAIPYGISLLRWTNPKIWRVLPADRLNGDGKQVFEPIKVSGFERVKFALMFSVFSAFQLGWRDLNVGTWLTRLQGTEYSLRGSGWVRTLSGAQSLLSVYLLAMWALTQFGRLFDG
jgi:hypothetical protein